MDYADIDELNDELLAYWRRRATSTGMWFWWTDQDLDEALGYHDNSRVAPGLLESVERRREHTLSLLIPLLHSGELRCVDLEGERVSPWTAPASEQVQRIRSEWEKLGQLQSGDICVIVDREWTPEAIDWKFSGLLDPIESATVQAEWLWAYEDGASTDYPFQGLSGYVRCALAAESRGPADINVRERAETLRIIEPLLRAGHIVEEGWKGTTAEWCERTDEYLEELAGAWPIGLASRYAYETYRYYVPSERLARPSPHLPPSP